MAVTRVHTCCHVSSSYPELFHNCLHALVVIHSLSLTDQIVHLHYLKLLETCHLEKRPPPSVSTKSQTPKLKLRLQSLLPTRTTRTWTRLLLRNRKLRRRRPLGSLKLRKPRKLLKLTNQLTTNPRIRCSQSRSTSLPRTKGV